MITNSKFIIFETIISFFIAIIIYKSGIMLNLILNKELVLNSIFTIMFFNIFLILGSINLLKSLYLYNYLKNKFFPIMTFLYGTLLIIGALNINIYSIVNFFIGSVLYFLVSLKLEH